MKKNVFQRIFLFSLLLIFAHSSVQAMGIEAAIGVWRQDPSGDFGFRGESLSIENELKYDAESRISGRIKIDTPFLLPNVYLMATPANFQGEGSKNADFTFGDQVFSGNIPFSSKLKLDHYDLALYYGLPFLKTATLGVLNAEAGLNARFVDLKAEIRQASTGISESKSFLVPVPMLYVAVHLKPVKYISLEVEGRGGAYRSNRYFDFIGRLKVHPFGPVFLAGGYRYESVKIDYRDVRAKAEIGGPFLELGFVF